MSVADGTISYLCRAPSHRAVDGDWVLARLHVHIHEAEWAFCPAGEPNAHEWVAIEPTRLPELKLRLAGKIPLTGKANATESARQQAHARREIRLRGKLEIGRVLT